MKKLNLNMENLKLKKLQLMKSKVANLTNENMMEVLGGGGTTGYQSCAIACGGTTIPPTGALATCPAACTTGYGCTTVTCTQVGVQGC